MANCFILENIKFLMDKGGVGAVFLDSKKTFETVNHEMLLSWFTFVFFN